MFQGFLARLAARAGVNRDSTRGPCSMTWPIGTPCLRGADILLGRAPELAALWPRPWRSCAWPPWLGNGRGRRLSSSAALLAIAATGFAGMVYNMTLAFAFQALYGYVYLWIGRPGPSVSWPARPGRACSYHTVPPTARTAPAGAVPLRAVRETLVDFFRNILGHFFSGLAHELPGSGQVPVLDNVMKGAFLLLCLVSKP